MLEAKVVEPDHRLAILGFAEQGLELVGGGEQPRIVFDRLREQRRGVVAAIEFVARDHRGEVAVARAHLGILFGVDQPLHEVEAVAPVTLIGDEPQELGEQQVIRGPVRERLAVHLARGRAVAEFARTPVAGIARTQVNDVASCVRLSDTLVMGTTAESVRLDEDVHEELRKLAKCSGRPLGTLANDALRDFVRYENQVAAAIDRGITDLEAGRTQTIEEVFTLLEQQRLARTVDEGCLVG